MLEAPKVPWYGRSPHTGATKCKALRNARRYEMQKPFKIYMNA